MDLYNKTIEFATEFESYGRSVTYGPLLLFSPSEIIALFRTVLYYLAVWPGERVGFYYSEKDFLSFVLFLVIVVVWYYLFAIGVCFLLFSGSTAVFFTIINGMIIMSSGGLKYMDSFMKTLDSRHLSYSPVLVFWTFVGLFLFLVCPLILMAWIFLVLYLLLVRTLTLETFEMYRIIIEVMKGNICLLVLIGLINPMERTDSQRGYSLI